MSNSSKEPGVVAIEYRWLIIAGLSLVILVMLFMWQPWIRRYDKNSEAIDVTGSASLQATPDKIVFSPSYQFDETDKQVAVDAASRKNTEVTGGLKKLGVTDAQIKSSTSGYGNGVMPMANSNKTYTYSLSFTITLSDTERAQKVQDYLATTAPEGEVTPSYGFTAQTQSSLEAAARDDAIKDARKKAEQTAKGLGFSLGGVKSVTDNSFNTYSGPFVMDGVRGSEKVASSFTLQPGKNELTYTVQVSFYMR
ncbi:SIMPL domain-containing protein [Candidatus Saccharibacteria bacterium]|nr:SIMPL domain-containing protein [Candidatus Saccharibacteria bacterium]